MAIAFLPLKKNSERIPNKNLRIFMGKPLFLNILDSLENVHSISKVVIDTDMPEEVSELIGESWSKEMLIYKRDNNLLAGDTPMNDIIGSNMDVFLNETIVQVHATSPLLSSKILEKAISIFESSEKNETVMGADIIRKRVYYENGKPFNHSNEKMQRTQDMDPLFAENSTFFIFNKNIFEANNGRVSEKPLFVATPILESIDIDEEKDWKMAEVAWKAMHL